MRGVCEHFACDTRKLADIFRHFTCSHKAFKTGDFLAILHLNRADFDDLPASNAARAFYIDNAKDFVFDFSAFAFERNFVFCIQIHAKSQELDIVQVKIHKFKLINRAKFTLKPRVWLALLCKLVDERIDLLLTQNSHFNDEIAAL